MPIKAIIFDLEGTIIDTEPVWDDCAIEFLRRHGHVYNRAGMQSAAIIFTTTKERLAAAGQVVHHFSEIKL